MKIAKILLFAFLPLLILSNCTDDSTNPNESNGLKIIPLSVGNAWTYEVRTESDTISETVTVGESIEIDGSPWYTINQKLYANKTDGHYWMDKFDDENRPTLIWKYPAKKGDKFNYDISNVTVISTKEEVSVPAGTFKCYLFEVESVTIAFYSYQKDLVWMKPGVGMIKTITSKKENIDDEPTFFEEKVLTSYELK